MEWCSESNPRKKLKNDEDEGRINLQKKSLLYLFVEYVWNKENGRLSGGEDVKLINWLDSVNLDVNNDDWDSSADLDIRTELRIQVNVFKVTKFNENIVRATRDLNDRIVCARLAYILRKLLPFLINCKNNVEHTSVNGQTILHAFTERYLRLSKHLSETELISVQNLVKELMARGLSLYEFDKCGKSPLHYATVCRNIQILEVMISCLINVNERDEEGNTALHIVVDNCVDEIRAEHKNGYVDIIRNLVSKGADVSVKNKKGMTAAHLASEKFHDGLLKFFMDNGADFSQRTNENENALHLACKSSLKLRNTSKMGETIDFLVRRGCDIEAYDQKGLMPLHYTVECGSVEDVQRLIELGANVNCQTKLALMTPLHLAARYGRLDVMRKLVELGADVNAEAADGVTPIFMTTLSASLASIEYLIDQGADLYHRDKLRGFTLLHMAAYGIERKDPSKMNIPITRNDIRDEELSKILFNFLIKKEFNVNDPGSCGVTPLHLASIAINIDNVKSLVEHGADVNYQSDKSEMTALHIASMMENPDIVEILIKAGADVNCRGGPQQWTPLHFVLARGRRWTLGKYDKAVVDCRETSSLENVKPNYAKDLKFSFFDVMTTLVKNGADVNVKDASGKSPLHLATLRTASRSSKFLLESGAHVNVQDNEGQTPLSNALQNTKTKILQNLLDYGEDINDEDLSQQIMDSQADLKEVALEHVIKLKLLGLPFAKIYKSPIEELAFADFYDRCLKELDRLKNHHVGNLSLYQFLRMNVERQYLFVEQISSSYESLRKIFPIYFCIIRGTCREAIIRKSLLEPARFAWNQVSNVYLPYVCIDNILSHINNRYLGALIVSAKPNEQILIDGSRHFILIGEDKIGKK